MRTVHYRRRQGDASQTGPPGPLSLGASDSNAPSVGSQGDAYDNALSESVIGVYQH